MKTVLPLNSGINKDVNPLYIDSAKGEVTKRENCRIYSADGGRVGINASIKGMTEVSASLPAGTNRIIGYVEDKEREQGIFFNWNSNGDDSIYVYTGSLVRNLGVPNGVLGFSADLYVDAVILGDYCVFTDNENPPRKVKMTNSNGITASNILSGATATTIQLAVQPPSGKPTMVVSTDSSRVVNKLVGKTFQFAYMWIYDDYTYSVLSPYSDIVVSNSVFSAEDNTYKGDVVGNLVSVTYNLGGSNVRSAKLLAREGNTGSWFVVEEYDTDGAGGTRTISFYNDVARKGLTETEALNLYSDVPRLAKAVTTVQNRIALGNVLKGYNRTEPLYNLSVEYETVSVSGTSTNLPITAGLVSGGVDEDDEYYVNVDLTGTTPTAGDIINIDIFGRYHQEIGTDVYFFTYEYQFSYVVQAGDTAMDIRTAIIYDIDSKNSDIVTYDYGNKKVGLDYSVYGTPGIVATNSINIVFGIVWFETGDDAEGGGAGSYVSQAFGSASLEVLPTGVSTFKSGSYYNVGLLFYDKYSRTSGVLNPQKVYIPHAGERDYANAFDKAKIAFELDETTAPDWAEYYRFAITESVNFAGVYPFVAGNSTDTNIYEDLYIDGQKVIAINLPTNLQYEFAKGDYLQIEVDNGVDTITTIRKTIIGTRTLIDISGTETSGFWLIIPQGEEAASDYDGQLAYIYRTKDTVQDLVYFEDSNTYDVVSEVMQTSSGYIEASDAWFVNREFEWNGGAAVTETVEDFYINVDDAIRAYSRGRAVVEFDTLGEIRLQDVVWSFNYLDNTKINGISTFNSLNRKQLDEKDGGINALRLVGDVLKVVQDNKETSLYIGKTQFRDGTGALSVVRTNDFIGDTYPSVEDFGSRYAKSVVKNNRNMYYFDSDRGIVVRSSANGQIPISDYGMKSEFLRIKKDIDNALSVDSRSVKIVAFFDIRNDEYVITFDIRGNCETWAFKEGLNQWVSYYDYTNAAGDPPTMYGNIGELSLAFLKNVWRMDDTTSYNTFFGDSKQLSVQGVLNIYPREEKCLRSLEMDSNRGADTTITSPVTNTHPVGQKSILYKETYRDRDGSFISAVFKNILQVGGAENQSLLHIGDDMVGKYLQIEFTDDGSTEFQLRNVTANFTINK